MVNETVYCELDCLFLTISIIDVTLLIYNIDYRCSRGDWMAREKYQTLTEQMFYILICLTQESCGVDIMKKVEELTSGRVIIGPGTLYSLLDNFVKEKIIIETKIENRKKSYIITKLGAEMLEKEYERLNKLKKDYEILVKGGGNNEEYN